jgi:hypothetical protein
MKFKINSNPNHKIYKITEIKMINKLKINKMKNKININYNKHH